MTVFAPIIIPLLYVIAALMTRSKQFKQSFAVVAAVVNLLWALYLVYTVNINEMVVSHTGSRPAPFSIVLVADRFSALMVLVSAFLFLATTIYSIRAIDETRKKNGFFLLSFGILTGVNGSLMAGDLFNLYVWFEVMLMGSFILISFGGEKQQLEGAIKYLILNLIGSFFLLGGVGILYGEVGTPNFADLSQKISASEELFSMLTPALVLFVVGIAIKAALFPFFFWLPASYHTPPPAVTALFAGLLTKVGIYALIRVYTLVLYQDDTFWNPFIMWMGVLSMVIGVLAASSQRDFRKILSFHIISQIGYVVIGLAFFTVKGLAAAIFFLVHNMLAKTNAFLVAGWVHKERGHLDLQGLGDMFRKSTLWGTLFFVSAFSLAGLPPLSGFAGKFLVIKSGIMAGETAVAMVALFVGFFTLFSMVKIWVEVFWKPDPVTTSPAVAAGIDSGNSGLMLFSSVMMAVAIIALGVFARPFAEFCEAAAADLLDPEKYRSFVLLSD